MSELGTLANLERGDIVKTRDGFYLVVLPNIYNKSGLATYSRANSGCSCYLSGYNNDLTHKYTSDDDIMSIYKHNNATVMPFIYDLLRSIFTETNPRYIHDLITKWNIKPDWSRDFHKEMTIKEIESILGYSIKIIDDKED